MIDKLGKDIIESFTLMDELCLFHASQACLILLSLVHFLRHHHNPLYDRSW